MYICRHCGLEYKTDEAVMCPRCQAPKGKGENFCPFCGAQAAPQQKVCMSCGVEMETYGSNAVKSKIAAGLLAIFLGSYGVHNFYLGYIKRAVIQLLSILGSFVLYFIAIFAMVFSDTWYYSDAVYGLFGFAVILLVIVVLGVRIWSFVEGVLILCGKINKDGKGRALK